MSSKLRAWVKLFSRKKSNKDVDQPDLFKSWFAEVLFDQSQEDALVISAAIVLDKLIEKEN